MKLPRAREGVNTHKKGGLVKDQASSYYGKRGENIDGPVFGLQKQRQQRFLIEYKEKTHGTWFSNCKHKDYHCASAEMSTLHNFTTGLTYSPRAVLTFTIRTTPSGPGKTSTTRPAGHEPWDNDESLIKTKSSILNLDNEQTISFFQ